MLKRSAVRLSLLVVASLLAAVPATAQFQPRSLDDPATGEQYHIEGAIGLWSPNTTATILSEGTGPLSGIAGTLIDLKRDLGLTDQRFPEFKAVLRPARRHKLRFQFIPIKHEQQSSLVRDVVFNGLRYQVGLPVNSTLNWKAYRFTYEYDFIVRNRGFVGFLLDAKYTDISASLLSPVNRESIRARAPIPTIGGIARFYVVPNISITGELSGVKLPESLGDEFDVRAHYLDVDIYGTMNFTNNIGAQLGYRTFDVNVNYKDDDYSLNLKGLYFGAVARF